MTTRLHATRGTEARKTWRREACLLGSRVAVSFMSGTESDAYQLGLDRAHSIPTQAKHNPAEAII